MLFVNDKYYHYFYKKVDYLLIVKKKRRLTKTTLQIDEILSDHAFLGVSVYTLDYNSKYFPALKSANEKATLILNGLLNLPTLEYTHEKIIDRHCHEHCTFPTHHSNGCHGNRSLCQRIIASH
jgi:hypothetical protein